MTLLFVRHGESEGNVGRIMQGWLDLPLSPRGHRQAEAVARRLAEARAGGLYASTLSRAWQTAAYIGKYTGLEPRPADGFREYDCGEAQGMRWDDVVARFGVTSRTWGTGLIPGEECNEPFSRRLTEAYESLARQHRHDTAIVVAHGGVIARLVTYVLGAPPDAWLPFQTPGNASITAFATDGDRHVVTLLNDACHLRDLATGET